MKRFVLLPFSFLMFSATACSFMPSTGPRASYILDKKKNSIPVYEVTEEMAKKLKEDEKESRENYIQQIVEELKTPKSYIVRIQPGDVIKISLWAESEKADGTTQVPESKDLGSYPVNASGEVDLPYLGFVSINNMTPHEAEEKISSCYSKTQVFPSVVANIQVSENKKENVIVMGAVNAPTVINWSEGGIDLSEAIAQSGGFKVFDPSKQGSDLGINSILLIRRGVSFNIPMKTALSESLPLQPRDRIVLQHQPLVRAICLGAGWKNPTMVPFDVSPSLTQVLAGAGDMNMNTAQGRAIFVFKHNEDVIYRINFDRPEGMEAAQNFPINDEDLIYIPPSRSVTLQQIVSIIMSVGYPAATGAAIR